MFRFASSKILLASLSLAGAFLLAGTSPVVAGESMDRINKSGVMRVGVSGSQPPFNMQTKDGKLIGMEIDLANALAAAMGVRVEFVVKDFAKLLASVEKGQIDIALSGLTMTPERNRKVAFAGPYFASGKGLVTTSAALARLGSLAEIGTSSYTLVALEGSTSHDVLESSAPKSNIVSVKNYDAGIAMVLAGEADAMLADYPICVVASFKYAAAGVESVEAPMTFEPLGAAIAGDDPLFLNLVQNYFDTLEDVGLMDRLRSKWFENGSWLSLLP